VSSEIELLQRTTRSVGADRGRGGRGGARARSVLGEVEALRAEVEELRGLVRGHVSVGAMLFGGELDIPEVLSQFIARHPGIELSLREGSAQRMIDMLRDGSLDLSFAPRAHSARGNGTPGAIERGARGGHEPRSPPGRHGGGCRSRRSTASP